MPIISLGRALADPNLFAHHFRGKSWAAWKVFLAALFAEPPDEAALAIYRERTGRTTWPTAPFTEAAVIVGRRGGKSRTLALIAVYLACFPRLCAVSGPRRGGDDRGAGGRQGAGAGDLPLCAWALEGGADARAADRAARQRDDRTVATGCISRSARRRFRSTRGYTYAAVLCDEVAFWRSDETSLNPDVEILRALRPGLASIPGAMLLMASSPYAQAGRALQRLPPALRQGRRARLGVESLDAGDEPERRQADHRRRPTRTIRKAAKAEYGGEFRTDLADFVSRETVDAVTMWDRS